MGDLNVNIGCIPWLVEECYRTAREKGWWDDPREIGTQLALMHSELSEALEEYRNNRPLDAIRFGPNGKPEGFPIELADCIIRIADTCGRYNIDLEAALRAKLAYNKTRPHRHGGKAA